MSQAMITGAIVWLVVGIVTAIAFGTWAALFTHGDVLPGDEDRPPRSLRSSIAFGALAGTVVGACWPFSVPCILTFWCVFWLCDRK